MKHSKRAIAERGMQPTIVQPATPQADRPRPMPQAQYAVPQVGQSSPDGAYYWDGQAWKPTFVAEKKRKHVFRWFFIAVQLLFVLWIVVGAHTASGHATDCGSLTQADCDSARNAGAAIGVGLIVVFWVGVDLVLGVIRICVLLSRRSK